MGKADKLSRRLDWKVSIEKTMIIKYLLKTAGYVVYMK